MMPNKGAEKLILNTEAHAKYCTDLGYENLCRKLNLSYNMRCHPQQTTSSCKNEHNAKVEFNSSLQMRWTTSVNVQQTLHFPCCYYKASLHNSHYSNILIR